MADPKKSKKADVLAGSKSFADRLRQRRRALETGAAESANERMKRAQSTDSNN